MFLRRRIECRDGFSMSVQAGEALYCSPRIDDAPTYTAVEVGFPSDPEPLLTPFAEDKTILTETVYPWTPALVVLAVILKHGGMIDGELPPLQSEEEE